MKKIDPDRLDIRIDTRHGRLYSPVRENRDAQLHFMLHDNGKFYVIEFTHTYVPEPLRNLGIATKLAEKGMQLARANNYQVDLSCPFVKAFMEKHPEFKSMRVTYD